MSRTQQTIWLLSSTDSEIIEIEGQQTPSHSSPSREVHYFLGAIGCFVIIVGISVALMRLRRKQQPQPSPIHDTPTQAPQSWLQETSQPLPQDSNPSEAVSAAIPEEGRQDIDDPPARSLQQPSKISEKSMSSPADDLNSPGGQSQQLIEQIVSAILKGQIPSKEQVCRRLNDGVQSGTGEIFERCLQEQIQASQNAVKAETDELRAAKAQRRNRALNNIVDAWKQLQKERLKAETSNYLLQQILSAEPDRRLEQLLAGLDPNQSHPLTVNDIQKLVKVLKQEAEVSQDPEQGAGQSHLFCINFT